VKFRTIVFDNSPLSRLLEEAERDRNAMLRGLRTYAILRVTGMNVIETANITDDSQREAKLRLLKEITGAVNPYQSPNDLLADVARAYDAREAQVTLGDEVSWFAISKPEEITNELAAEGLRWHADREKWFREMFQDMRQEFQPMFDAGLAERPRSAGGLIKYFIEHRETYYDILLIPIYARQTGHTPTHEEFSRFLDRVPAWSLFWIARVYAMYRRVIQLKRFGKTNAGVHDLDSAIYLSFCDMFVTGDKPQERALRVVNAFSPRVTEVMSYRELRSRLLVA
jgi:hypothetical protein